MTTSASGISRQPIYRRPSWAQTEASYKIYTRKDLAADRSPGNDYGLDNFSYDPAHAPKWQAPVDITTRLPSKLRETVEDWEFAGAAVCTALDRIKKLDDESVHRGYPEKTMHGHLSRRVSTSQPSPAVKATESPFNTHISPVPTPTPLTLSFEGLPPRRMVGMESPPFTPTDTSACRTPDLPSMEKPIPPAAIPDAHQLSHRLSPISMRSRSDSVTTTTTSGGAVFDENAWETYIGTFKANLDDIRQHAWSRFKGFGYTIDRLRIELATEPENKSAIEDFNKWWTDMKPQVSEYEQKVRQLEVPAVELMRLERTAQGLPV